MLLGEDRADESEDRVVVGEHADDVGAPFDLLVDPLERVRGPDLAPVMPGEDGVGGHVVHRVREHGGGFGQGAFEPGGDLTQLAACSVRVWLGEDHANERGDHLGLPGGGASNASTGASGNQT